MKTIKTNLTFVIGIILFVLIFISAYIYLSSSSKETPHPVSCAIGDRFDIMTGKPCPVLIEEEPASTT